jgi:hypothetical protein
VEDEPALPGVEFEELLSIGSAKPGLSRRWTAAVLAVMAGVVCLGLGGRAVLGAPESNRNADPIAVAAGRAAVAPDATAETNGHPLPVAAQTSGPNPVRLPLGFAVEALPTSRRGDVQRVVVVGFVAQRQTISLRIIEPDGTVVSSTAIEAGAAGTSSTATGVRWAFQGILEVPPGDRGAGPDSAVLEILWASESGGDVTCAIALPSSWPAFEAAGTAAATVASRPIATMARCS